MDQLTGKVAVVTGAASGIGFSTAQLLARQGMKLVLADIDQKLLDEAAGKIKSEGYEAIGVQTDVGNFAAMKNLADVTYDIYGAPNVVHLNAGISTMGGFFDEDTETWKRITDINFLGVVWGIKAFVSRMIASGEEGVILATSSGAGAEGTNYISCSYAATKMAVVSIMESLYGQLRDQKSKVRAGVVFPPLTATRLAGDDPATMQGVEMYLRSSGVPATLVQPEQVAAMILDGIRHGRFFIGANERVSKECYDGAISPEYFQWSEKIIRGRSEAQLSDGKPDAYLW